MSARADAKLDVSVEDILLHLAGDESDLTEDEILYGPLDLVKDSLARKGLAELEIDFARVLAGLNAQGAVASATAPAALDEGSVRARRSAASAAGQARAAATPLQDIPRRNLLARLNMALHSAVTGLVVEGPTGVGKTHLVRGLLLKDAAFRAAFRRVVVIDCAALRMASAKLFSREAAWACFERDDDGFKAFLANSGGDGEQRKGGMWPITSLIRRRLQPGGLLILDHVEKLDRAGEIEQWISRELIPAINQTGGKAIFITRTPSTKRPLAGLKDMPQFVVAGASREELEAWVGQPAFARHVAAGLKARTVMRITGGRPALLRELGQFLIYANQQIGDEAVLGYAEWRLDGDRPMMDCERLIRAARRHGECIEKAIAQGSLSKAWMSTDFDRKVVDDLLSTGAVVLDDAGRIRFASPLISMRLRRLMRPDALACVALRSDLLALHDSGGWRAMRRFAELAADPIAKCIGHEQNPVVGFTRLIQIFERWGFDPTLYIRDSDNARLWAPFLAPLAIGPFENRKQPHFGQAAQTGQVVVSPDNRVFIPVTGNAGMVNMVVVLHFRRTDRVPHVQSIEIDRVVGILNGIRPTLAQMAQRLALRRDRKFQEAVLYRTEAGGVSAYQTVLREAGCQSLVVFERDPEAKEWFVSRFEKTGGGVHEGAPVRWAESVDTAGLDRIAFHPTGRGLVLSGREVERVFPRLTGEEAAVYLHPCRVTAGARIAAFLFRGGDVTLDGHVQSHLSVMAPGLLAIA